MALKGIILIRVRQGESTKRTREGLKWLHNEDDRSQRGPYYTVCCYELARN